MKVDNYTDSYWVIEWSYSEEYPKAIRKELIFSNDDSDKMFDTTVWNNFNTNYHTFDKCLQILADRMKMEQEEDTTHLYHWRMRDLHSGEIIPGDIL